MSFRIIDNHNPVILLESYDAKEKSKRNNKSSEKIILTGEMLNVWMLHLNTLYKESTDNLKLNDFETFIGSTSKSEIIHSTVGLFDICLPDMDLNTIYNSVVDKEAYTIIAFSSQANTVKRIAEKCEKSKLNLSKIELIKEFLNKNTETNKVDENEDVYSTGEDKEDDFKLIFHDEDLEETETEEKKDESSSEEEDTDDDFSQGYNKYMTTVYQRKLSHLTEDTKTLTDVGFENQIVGAISFKLRHVDVRRVVHVTMLGVLKPYRSRGLGRYLINLVLNPKIVGKFDAVVVHADFSACEFFKKFGFSDDALLNTQWHSLEPEYTNCSLLTYVPAYSSKLRENHLLAEEFSAAEMEVDMKLWQKRVTEVHCFQFQVFQRMKMEIEQLKETIKNQDKIMKTMMKELRESNKEKVRLERYLKSQLGSKVDETNESILSDLRKMSDEESGHENLELKVKNNFSKSLKMVNQSEYIRYMDFIPANVPSLYMAEFKAIRRSMVTFSPRLSDKSVPSNRILYFCESFSMTKEAKSKILTNGFSKEHRKPGCHGMGYYFASNPSAASIYSNSNSLIVADVILGNVYRNINDIQPLKDTAPEGYDSALVPSTFAKQMNNNASTPNLNASANDSYFFSQEFVIFDAAQALPLGLVKYSIPDIQ